MIGWLNQFWQSLHPAIQVIMGGLIVAALVGIITSVRRLVRKLTSLSTRKKAAEEDRLKKHFQEIYEEAMSSLSEANISEMYGLIVTYRGGTPQYHPDVVAIELPKFSNSFEAHFPEENKQYGNLTHIILRNNESYKDLRKKFTAFFQSEGILVVNINRPLTKSPVVYDNIFWPLFSWWSERSQGKTNPHPDFEQIETIDDFGPNHLVVSGWRSGAMAYAVGLTDQQRCKEVITGIAKNVEYQNEAVKIIHSANEIAKQFRTIKGQIINTLDDTQKFWPGTQNYEFKIEDKKCARCKQIFG